MAAPTVVGQTGLAIAQVAAGRIAAALRIVVKTGQAQGPAIGAEAVQTVAERPVAVEVAIALATAAYRRAAVADRGAVADFLVLRAVPAMNVRAVHAVPRA